MSPEPVFRGIKVPPHAISTDTQYIVVPVQTQAMGYAPPFRAAVSAQLETALKSNGLNTTRQTDLIDSNGPFVRRFDEDTLQALLKQHKQQKLIMLYVGQDRANSFVTLVVRGPDASTRAHQTLELSKDPQQALELFSKALPALLKEAGLTKIDTTANAAAPDTNCTDKNWDFSLATPTQNGLQQACHALALGTLLPVYDGTKSQFPTNGNLISPVKQAWLAKAYAQAAQLPFGSSTAQAIRDLALFQLGLSNNSELSPMLISSMDPVVSQVTKLLFASGSQSKSQVKNSAEFVANYAKSLQKLPALTQSLMVERLNVEDPFKPIDFCAIAGHFPGITTPNACPAPAVQSQPAQAKTYTGPEVALYQDWRLASYYKEIARYAINLSAPEQALKLFARLPEDVVNHPYLQQVKYVAQASVKFTGSTGDFLSYSQAMVKPFLQATVNLQSYDIWLAAYSLSEHSGIGGSQQINGDKQIQDATVKEAQLLKILKADQFLTPSVPTPQQNMMAAAIQAAPKTGARKQELFPLSFHLFKTQSDEQLRSKIAADAGDMNARAALAFRHLKEGKPLQEAISIINAYPKSAQINDRLKESHDWATPAHYFFFSGEADAAKQFYQRSLAMGTGSSSEFHAQTRLKLMDRRLGEAMQSSIQALARYNSDFTRRDLASFLFMENQADMGWKVTRPRAATSETFQLWVATYVAQRMEGKNLNQINDWLKTEKYDSVQVDFQNVNDLYLLMHAVTDRVPGDDDIKLLLEPLAPNKYKNKTFAVSARLAKSALEQSGTKEAYEFAIANLTPDDGNKRGQFVLPFFAWVAWQATDGKDANLDTVRNADLHESFDHVLAKSMIFALEGKSRESLQYLKAARYALSESGKPEMTERAIPASYQYAVAAYLMFKKTGNDAYRTEALQFLRAYELVFPYYGWVYSMQVALEKDKKKQQALACKAKVLDPGSYFLSLGNLDLNKLSCKTVLW
ncbi:MAG: hypothetical protein V4495_14250 [Pseudomonadota bacterium]